MLGPLATVDMIIAAPALARDYEAAMRRRPLMTLTPKNSQSPSEGLQGGPRPADHPIRSNAIAHSR